MNRRSSDHGRIDRTTIKTFWLVVECSCSNFCSVFCFSYFTNFIFIFTIVDNNWKIIMFDWYVYFSVFACVCVCVYIDMYAYINILCIYFSGIYFLRLISCMECKCIWCLFTIIHRVSVGLCLCVFNLHVVLFVISGAMSMYINMHLFKYFLSFYL